jgi:hypothetical protein
VIRLVVSVLVLAASILPNRAGLSQGLDLDCSAFAVRPTAGTYGYRERDGDARCEGFYEPQVSATGLELVSATIGSITFEPATHDRAIIEVPSLPIESADAIAVRIVALPLGLHYRLDARARPGSTLTWPLGAVVEPSRLKSTDLGAFAYFSEEDDRIIVPVMVAPPDAAPSGSGIELALRSPVDLETVWWRQLHDNGASGYQEIPGFVYGGDVIRFAVPDSDDERLRLEFRARLANSNRQRSLTLTLQRPS